MPSASRRPTIPPSPSPRKPRRTRGSADRSFTLRGDLTMSFLTGKHLPRRTFLRGAGAAVALPFLDAMTPAGVLKAAPLAAGKTRFIAIEEVHGLAGCQDWAAKKLLFAPAQVGKS